MKYIALLFFMTCAGCVSQQVADPSGLAGAAVREPQSLSFGEQAGVQSSSERGLSMLKSAVDGINETNVILRRSSKGPYDPRAVEFATTYGTQVPANWLSWSEPADKGFCKNKEGKEVLVYVANVASQAPVCVAVTKIGENADQLDVRTGLFTWIAKIYFARFAPPSENDFLVKYFADFQNRK